MIDEEFFKKGYKVVKGFLPKDFCKFALSYFKIRQDALQYTIDPQCPRSKSFYADPFCETLLVSSGRKISDLIGVELIPTYSYARIYARNEKLKKHKDRPECQFSATLCLAYPEEEGISSIFMAKQEDESDRSELFLEVGDLCIYMGNEIYHWRPPFKHSWYLQTFLHYVDSNGIYKDRLYDGRFALGVKLKNA